MLAAQLGAPACLPAHRRGEGKTATLHAPLGDIPLHMLGGTVSPVPAATHQPQQRWLLRCTRLLPSIRVRCIHLVGIKGSGPSTAWLVR